MGKKNILYSPSSFFTFKSFVFSKMGGRAVGNQITSHYVWETSALMNSRQRMDKLNCVVSGTK